MLLAFVEGTQIGTELIALSFFLCQRVDYLMALSFKFLQFLCNEVGSKS